MGLDGLSIWHLLVIFMIVVVIFGAGRLRTIGSDLGKAVRSFREALNGEEPGGKSPEPGSPTQTNRIEPPPPPPPPT
jgi:sec-independent protein translocase protein TatA